MDLDIRTLLKLVLQLIVFLLNISIIGEVVRRILKKKINSLRAIDPIQVLLLDVYLGCLVLYIIALPPLGLFRRTYLIILTGISWAIVIFLILKEKAYQVLWSLPSFLRERSLERSVVIGLFLWNLWISLGPYAEFSIGDLSDIWLHSFFITLIMDNGHLPRTLAPFSPAPVFYPLGFHVMATYSVYILGWNALLASAYVCVLFKAMAPLAGYALGRLVDREGHLGLTLSLVFGLISRWPRLIPYEAGPFISGFPLLLLIIGFSAGLELRRPDILFSGLLCGLLFVIYPMYFLSLIHI